MWKSKVRHYESISIKNGITDKSTFRTQNILYCNGNAMLRK